MPAAGAASGAPVTVGQWLARWLAARASPGASTLRSYAGHVRLYLGPYLGDVVLAELSVAQVQAMFAAIARQRAMAGMPVSPATLARVRATLRAALNAAVRAGYITANPAALAGLPPARRPRAVVWTAARVEEWQRTGVRPPVAVWTPAQTAAFLNSVRGDRLYRVSPDRAARAAPRRGLRAALV